MSDYHTFPGFTQATAASIEQQNLELLERDGYFIVENVLSEMELASYRKRLDVAWERQMATYGQELLSKVGDYGTVRAMMVEEPAFLTLITHPELMKYVALTLGDTAILHLQNGVVIHPGLKHQQARYHKDFPKDFLSTKRLSFNGLFAIDQFDEQTGGTWVLPGSHRFVEMPSDPYIERHAVQIRASAGSVIFFDSMLWHRGGTNKSGAPRRAVNHQFTRPFIKQQLDYPAFIKGVDKESKLAQVLGFWTVPPKGAAEYRVSDPSLRTYRAGQG